MIYYLKSEYIGDLNIGQNTDISLIKELCSKYPDAFFCFKKFSSFVKAFNNEQISDLGFLFFDEDDSYPLVSISREELELQGYDTKDVDETTISEIAEELGESISETAFSSLPYFTEKYGIPRKQAQRITPCCGAPLEEDEDECPICGSEYYD